MISILTRKSTNLFEDTPHAKKVEKLDIVFPNYDISRYWEDFLQFTNLKELNLQSDIDNTDLPPKEIGQLRKLRTLYILNYNFKEFPEWIFELGDLSNLMIRGNDIQTIPDQISRLVKLTKLRIENCGLKETPFAFSRLNNLKQLSLSDNKSLTYVDVDYLPKRLRSLNLAFTRISEDNLKTIRLRFPKLKINEHID